MAARSWALLLSPLLLTPAPRVSVCPPPLAVDASRERALIARLATHDEARALVVEASRFMICFGRDVEAGTMADGTIQLDRRLPDAEAAARVAHLLVHARPGSALRRAPEGDCARWVSEALDEEARAHALEIEVSTSAGARPTWPFVEEVIVAPPAARTAMIRAWLAAHPDGGGGVPPLGRSYAARCAQRATREGMEAR